MLKVFTIPNIPALIASIQGNVAYSSYTITYNKAIEIDSDSIPSILIYTKSNDPDSTTESDSAGNHNRSIKLACRIYLDKDAVDSLEEVADKLFDTINTYAKTDRSIKQIGNPSLNQVWEDTEKVQVADLDIPIFFRTKAN